MPAVKKTSKREQTRNRTNKNTETRSQIQARRDARNNGRGQNAAFTSGARSVDMSQDNAQAMRRAWESQQNVQAYTRTPSGRMSADGRKAGGSTWTYTDRDIDGNLVRQSGRSRISNRRQRDYDTRVGMNNISARTVERWKQLGWVREVDGNMVGDGQNVRGITIRQKADGNYSMGLSAG